MVKNNIQKQWKTLFSKQQTLLNKDRRFAMHLVTEFQCEDVDPYRMCYTVYAHRRNQAY